MEVILRSIMYFVFHHVRLFGWLPAGILGLFFSPYKTAALGAGYALVHRQRWWQVLVHKSFGYGASKRCRLINPYKHLYNQDQKYLICIHPHCILLDGIHSAVAYQPEMFDGTPGVGHPTEVRSAALCFAPIIKHVPAHQEMYRNLCSSAGRKDIEQWWGRRMPDGAGIDPAICPGGFAECCFSNAWDRENEYLYLKGRKGFLTTAIKNGADIAPLYSFNSTNMYHNFPWLKGARARLSQKIFIGLSWPLGRYGTFMPLTDKVISMWLPPFPASKYSLEQVDQAHADYCAHLKAYFDKHKAEYGQEGCEMQFVGKDYVDRDWEDMFASKEVKAGRIKLASKL